MTTTATKPQLSAIGALMHKLNLAARKEDIVLGFTGGRTGSRAGLYKEEATALIQWLKKNDPDEVAADKMRRKIIMYAHQLAWKKPGTNYIDMKRVDDWCKKYGYLHKSLDNYTLQELPQLVTQFESMFKSFLERL